MVASASTKHQMQMVKALSGAVRSLCLVVNGSMRTFMDAFPLDDLTDENVA